jgi:hypothetical protein
LGITDADRPPTVLSKSEIPPKELRKEILELARKKKWSVEDVEAHFRRELGRNVPVKVIRWVFEQGK